MRPIPVAFHIWFLEVHTYGVGLALTFWFGLRYAERRLRKAGYPWQWVTGMFVWVIVSAIVGARALHVLSNLSFYSHHPGQVIAIWQGGLSSFGGLLFAVPVAIVSSRRRCPQLPTLRFADLMAPVLMACWGIGRLLGPQLMVAGGGHPTNQWFGMYYAGQVGKRLPVPIFQSIEDFTIFGILLLVERWLRTQAPGPCRRQSDRSGGEPPVAAAPAGGHRPRGRHGALGHRALPRRAPVARRGRPPRLAAGPGGGHRPGGDRRRPARQPHRSPAAVETGRGHRSRFRPGAGARPLPGPRGADPGRLGAWTGPGRA